MDKKPFKDTAIGKFLTDKLPDIANTIGDVLPSSGVTGIIKNIISDPNQSPQLTDADRIAGLQAVQQYELELEQEDTKRIQSYNDVEKVQVASDDNYTRRARPTLQYATMLMFVLCYPVSTWITGTAVVLPDTLLIILGSIVGVYSVGRTIEKATSIKTAAGQPAQNNSMLAKSLRGLMGK